MTLRNGTYFDAYGDPIVTTTDRYGYIHTREGHVLTSPTFDVNAPCTVCGRRRCQCPCEVLTAGDLEDRASGCPVCSLAGRDTGQSYCETCSEGFCPVCDPGAHVDGAYRHDEDCIARTRPDLGCTCTDDTLDAETLKACGG